MKKIIPVLLVLMLLLTACKGKPDTEPSANPVPPPVSETPTPTPTPELFYHPLTGRQIDQEFGNARPYAFMINNINFALPHCGLSKADMIYEILAEGEITRMMAIFSDISQAGAIGSVRSARPYYIDVALGLDAIYVHAGGSDQAYSDIPSKGVDNVDGVRGSAGNDGTFYRDKARQQQGYATEHTLFTSGENVLNYVAGQGIRTEHSSDNFDYGLVFAPDGTEPDQSDVTLSPATSVNVSFSGLKTTILAYDSASGLYTASQYNQPLIDGNNNDSVVFKNVLVLFAEHTVIDDQGRRIVNIEGTGEGHYIVNGQSSPITWSRSSGGVFTYYKANGQPLELSAGTSYIGIVPTGSTITMA